MNVYRNSEIIKKAYEILGDFTPLDFDCGCICNSKCCKGTDSDGMLLFPGEKYIYENNNNFEVYFDEKYKNYCLRCNGYCDRNERPLSCRIFPYFLYYKEDNTISVAPDIRSIDFCPVISEKMKVDRKFLRALRICSSYLCQYKEMQEFLSEITLILTDFNSL